MESDDAALCALEEMRYLAESLVESDRWLFDSADRLLTDSEDCGPGLLPSMEKLGLVTV